MEKNKSEEELIDKTNTAISELVVDKDSMQKAFNYYNGVLDAEQYRYIKDNYGIGNPTSVEFVPLIRKHVDALVGEFLGTPILPKISCKDSKTISNITREKELMISSKIYKMLQQRLKNKLLEFMEGNDPNKLTDPYIQQEIEKLVEDLNNNFISQYEIAAQNVLQYVMQSRQTDFINKLKQLIIDLLCTGYTFYQVKPSPNKTNVQIEVLNPMNVFPDKNPNSPYIKDSYRIVSRKWLTRTQILNTYGNELSKDDIQNLKDNWQEELDYTAKYIKLIHTQQGQTLGIMGDTEAVVSPGYPNKPSWYNHTYDMIPVYEVEWTEVDKDFVMQLYQTVRIGQNIYILRGKKEDVRRSYDNPSYCSLTINGVYFENRNAEPFSLVLACATLQDKYNLLHFYRDNLIANSGTVGDWIDISIIPSQLGVNIPERLKKWQALKKQGIALLNTAEEGRLATGQAQLNTIFNGYDDTVKAQAIQAIQLAIDSVEQTCSSITGVFRERLNGIESKDAVTNVKIGQQNSFTISKQWYQQMDTITEEILTDCLDEAKIVYKNGISGQLILGDKFQQIFTALPEHFTHTDYDIHVVMNSEITKDLESIKQIIPEFVKAGAMDPLTIFDVMTCKSLTDAKYKVRIAMQKAKEENNQIGQLQQQLQQAQQQVQQLQQQAEQAQKKVEQLNEQKLQIEAQKNQLSYQVEQYKAQTDRTFKEATAKNDTKRTEIELLQLRDGNPYNDEVKNV